MTWLVYVLGVVGALMIVVVVGMGLGMLAIWCLDRPKDVADYSSARNDSERGLRW